MEIEVTGSIKDVRQRILSVSEDLEVEASYSLILTVQLDQGEYLRLKRMELLEEPLCIRLKAAQMELPEEVHELLGKPSIFSIAAAKEGQDADGPGADVGRPIRSWPGCLDTAGGQERRGNGSGGQSSSCSRARTG